MFPSVSAKCDRSGRTMVIGRAPWSLKGGHTIGGHTKARSNRAPLEQTGHIGHRHTCGGERPQKFRAGKETLGVGSYSFSFELRLFSGRVGPGTGIEACASARGACQSGRAKRSSNQTKISRGIHRLEAAEAAHCIMPNISRLNEKD